MCSLSQSAQNLTLDWDRQNKTVSKLLLKLISESVTHSCHFYPQRDLALPYRSPDPQDHSVSHNNNHNLGKTHVLGTSQGWHREISADFYDLLCVFNCLFRFSFTWIGPRMSHSKQLSRHSLHRLTARSCLPQCRQTRSNLRATDWQLKLAHIRSQPKHLHI